MIRSRSLQHVYSEFWSGDPAFRQPPDPPKEDPAVDPKAWETWKKAIEEHARLVKVARETGNWDALRIEGGEEPTVFQMRPVNGDVFRRLVDDNAKGDIGGTETIALLFRIAVTDTTFDGVKEVGRMKHSRYGDMANPDLANKLDKINPAIVGELGSTVRDRCTGVLPLL